MMEIQTEPIMTNLQLFIEIIALKNGWLLHAGSFLFVV